MALQTSDPVRFEAEIRRAGPAIRALCIATAPAPRILAVSRLSVGDQVDSFDARALAGRRLLVPDPQLVPVLRAAFASFDPPVAPPVFVQGGPHEAKAAVVVAHQDLAGSMGDVALADFSSMRRELFRALYPHLRTASVLTEMYTLREGMVGPASSRITAVEMEEIVFGPASLEGDPVLEQRFAAIADRQRTRELQARFFARLYAVADRNAAVADRQHANQEAEMARQNILATHPNHTAAPARTRFRLETPGDYLRGLVYVSLADLIPGSVSHSSTPVRKGMMFRLAIGSNPPRALYVHHLHQDGNLVVLAPWMPVVMPPTTPALGSAPDGRPVYGLAAPPRPVHPASPAPAAGTIVGDNTLVGELDQTDAGTWTLLEGEPPGGWPIADGWVTDLARASRLDQNGRLQHVCIDSPQSLSQATCANAGGVWDTPCARDHECPFHSADARGGCVAGYCEMPIGVRNRAFRVPEGEPACRNCGAGDHDPLRCCGRQLSPLYIWPDTT